MLDAEIGELVRRSTFAPSAFNIKNLHFVAVPATEA